MKQRLRRRASVAQTRVDSPNIEESSARTCQRLDTKQKLFKVPLFVAFGCLLVSLLASAPALPEQFPHRNLRGAIDESPVISSLDRMMPTIPDIVDPEQRLVSHGEILPTSEEISEMRPEQRQQRNEYFESYLLALIFVHIAALELVRQLWNCGIRAYMSRNTYTSVTEGESRELESTQKGNEKGTEEEISIGSLSAFVVYHIHYNYGCLALAAFAWWTERVSGDTGLDWELYFPWVYSVMLVQWILLVALLRASTSEIPSIGLKCFLSFVPGASDKMNVMKDAVTTAIYATHGGWFGYMLGFTSILTIVWPDIIVYQSRALVSDMMTSYLDPYMLPSRRELSDTSVPYLVRVRLTLMRQSEELTSPLKRSMGLYEGVPQAILAVAFVVRYGFKSSLFVIVMGAVQIVQLILMHVARPYILCMMASNGQSWDTMTADDVRAAFLIKGKLFRRLTEPEIRFKAGKELLFGSADPITKEVVVKAIPEFMQQNELDAATKADAVKRIVLAKDVSMNIEHVTQALLSLGADEDTVKGYRDGISELMQEQGQILEQLHQLEAKIEAATKKIAILEEQKYDAETKVKEVTEQHQEVTQRHEALQLQYAAHKDRHGQEVARLHYEKDHLKGEKDEGGKETRLNRLLDPFGRRRQLQKELENLKNAMVEVRAVCTAYDPRVAGAEAEQGAGKPAELIDEDFLCLYVGQLVQTSHKRADGWSFGCVIHDDVTDRSLPYTSTAVNVSTSAGWFPISCTELPTSGQMLKLQKLMLGSGADALQPPAYWEEVKDPTRAESFRLEDGPEKQTVVNAFMATLRPDVQVVSVDRIQNFTLWQSYAVKRQTIMQGDPHAHPERVWLFHGAPPEVIDKIIQQGFNRGFCGRSATMYGKGVYFARDASYSSAKSYSAPDASGIQRMFLCRVAVGSYCKGKKDALAPDVKEGSTLYDTTVDNVEDPNTYVIYHDGQAYPEYLVMFKQP